MNEDQPLRIALDAMGGDFAPQNVVAGAVEALRAAGNRFTIILIGKESLIRSQIKSIGAEQYPFEIVHAPDIIDMHDGATAVLRAKKDSSIAIGMTLHKEGKVDAFVGAGHTGAMVSAATLILGRLDGVSRPTIGTFFPTNKGVCLILDAGANVDCKPQHLFEFGVMGSIYVRDMLNIQNPQVGLLNIGEEDSKGNEAVKEAYKFLSRSKLNFIGNIEGSDVLKGEVHVVVCDGFVGNIILKFAESIPSFLKVRMKDYFTKSLPLTLLGGMIKNSFRSMLRQMDYEEYGGIPVLGVKGVAIIGHGKSSPKAIKNMILKAEESVRKRVNERMQSALAEQLQLER